MAENILVVDDEKVVRNVLCRALDEERFHCFSAESAREALENLSKNSINVALIDIRMPEIDGIELLRIIKKDYPETGTIMVTADTDIVSAVQAMKLGASDYIIKPFNLEDVIIRINKVLDRQRLVMENQEYQKLLEERLREKTAELSEKNKQMQSLLMNAIKALVYLLEAKEEFMKGYAWNVARIASTLARYLNLREKEIEAIELAALLHDIGNIAIRESILEKEREITPEEFAEIKRHPIIAERILKPIEEFQSFLNFVKYHHEHFDGSGYPDGLKGNEIPLGARILSIADAYQAMVSARPYRNALSHEEALKEIEAKSGNQFDPELVRSFCKLFGKE
ncbi:MAG: response regulator [Firmicutes bacterium]|nr:response regulator [Bacillota bacterium]